MEDQSEDEIRTTRIDLGKKLREMRKYRGYSCVKLSQVVYEEFDYTIDSTTISKIETAASRPTIDFLLILCEIYGVSLGELIGGHIHRFAWLLNDISFFRRLEQLEKLYGDDMRELIRLLFDFMAEFANTIKRNGAPKNGEEKAHRDGT